MSRTTIILPLFFVLACFCPDAVIKAQDGATPLKQGEPIERTITRGETHAYSVRLEQDQFLQVVTDQHGIEVAMKANAPDGKQVGEASSPGSANGTEGMKLVARVPGLYQITVTAFEQAGNSGRYEIRILDLRQATRAEMDSAGSQDAIKAKGIALLNETAETVQQIRLPENRIRVEIQVVQLLWAADEKHARKLVARATTDINEYTASISVDNPNYFQIYQTVQQLRLDMIQILSVNDPELALNFLRSTRVLATPYEQAGSDPDSTEHQMELSLISRIAGKNPKRSLEVAEENLRKGYDYNFLETLNHLQSADPDSATKLASDIATKLEGESLLTNPAASFLLGNFLQMARPPASGNQTEDAGKSKPPLLSEGQYRDLFNKALSVSLAYTPSATNGDSVEKNSAQSLLVALKSLTDEMSKYAPGKMPVVEKALAPVTPPPDPESLKIQQYQETINTASVNQALEVIAQMPEKYKMQSYQQVASNAVSNGDFGTARQILNEHMTNPFQRQQVMKSIDQQAIYKAVNAGKLPEALAIISRLHVPTEQVRMIIYAVNQMMMTQKRETLIGLLEQARGLVGGSGRVEDRQQMDALFEIARTYLRLEPKRSFDVIEPIIDQFNEMSLAAVAMNGFDQQYLRDGELVMDNGSSLSYIVIKLSEMLGGLATSDFDRAKGLADKIQRPEVRLHIYLSIARQATSS